MIKILVVDDNFDVVEVFVEMLNQGGYIVDLLLPAVKTA